MRFLKPSFGTALPPLLLVAFAILPIDLLRYTFYSILALPLWPLIERLGWVYHDKPRFLTYEAAILAAMIWAVLLYLFLCVIRRVFMRA